MRTLCRSLDVSLISVRAMTSKYALFTLYLRRVYAVFQLSVRAVSVCARTVLAAVAAVALLDFS